MDTLMGLAISIGVLIGAWVWVGPKAGLAVPAGIIAWACFYAAGGKMQGLQKTIAANLSGVIWVAIANAVIGMGMGSIGFVIIGVAAFFIVLQAKIPALSFIPGGFCGAAVTAGSGATSPKDYGMVAVALVVGAVLGYVSELGGGMIAKKA